MKKKFIIYNAVGEILRTGGCSEKTFLGQAKDGEFIMEGTANDIIHKVQGGQVVMKTLQEIEASKPPVVLKKETEKRILYKEWDALVARVEALEK